MDKKFILNADDFGLSEAHNKAVLYGYESGLLKSTSLCSNTESFDDAILNVLPKCPDLSVGVHLNIVERKSLTNCPLLTDKNGNFFRSYLYLILNQNNKELLKQIEAEFRAQIEKTASKVSIDHLDSHVHTHGIPNIFKITCKLAKEYNIKAVRTHLEKPYLIPSLKKHLNFSYPMNLIKIALLGFFTKINKKTLKDYELKTNDFLFGIGYSGLMESKTVKYGLKKMNFGVVEALIHPCRYEEEITNSHTKEFEIFKDLNLKNEIENLGFELSSYKIFNQ